MGTKLSYPRLALLAVAAAALIGALERFVQPEPGGTLLLTMVIFLAIAEGCVALMAAAEITHGGWHLPMRSRMLAAQAMIPVVGLLFVVQSLRLEIYPWAESHGFWLNRDFFIARHLVLIALAFLVARRFAAHALRGLDSRRLWAVLYVLLFVFHQTIVGIEWVMSLERPWFSTLLGAFFVVSAFLSGITTGAIVLFFWRGRFDEKLRLAQKSIGGLMFGFATFWAYFYFSQLIVIWYGNLPEEVGYLAKRIGYHTPYWAVARLAFGMIWVIPFAVLLRRKNKTNPWVTMALAFTILTGFLLEKGLMIHPAASVHPVAVLLELAIAGAVFVAIMRGGEALLPGGGAARAESAAPAPVTN
ncbi:MAG: hypothetical protein OEO21_02385 [Candidatus Krumholzibacteria bacterium]|nr:hypothetical protein [Candidatus Krumholzibacteria bacterium]